ncbi:hypothetical protein EI555_017325, partial [Monodon monoceros]
GEFPALLVILLEDAVCDSACGEHRAGLGFGCYENTRVFGNFAFWGQLTPGNGSTGPRSADQGQDVDASGMLGLVCRSRLGVQDTQAHEDRLHPQTEHTQLLLSTQGLATSWHRHIELGSAFGVFGFSPGPPCAGRIGFAASCSGCPLLCLDVTCFGRKFGGTRFWEVLATRRAKKAAGRLWLHVTHECWREVLTKQAGAQALRDPPALEVPHMRAHPTRLVATTEGGELGAQQKVGDGWGDSLRPEDLVVLARRSHSPQRPRSQKTSKPFNKTRWTGVSAPGVRACKHVCDLTSWAACVRVFTGLAVAEPTVPPSALPPPCSSSVLELVKLLLCVSERYRATCPVETGPATYPTDTMRTRVQATGRGYVGPAPPVREDRKLVLSQAVLVEPAGGVRTVPLPDTCEVAVAEGGTAGTGEVCGVRTEGLTSLRERGLDEESGVWVWVEAKPPPGAFTPSNNNQLCMDGVLQWEQCAIEPHGVTNHYAQIHVQRKNCNMHSSLVPLFLLIS